MTRDFGLKLKRKLFKNCFTNCVFTKMLTFYFKNCIDVNQYPKIRHTTKPGIPEHRNMDQQRDGGTSEH